MLERRFSGISAQAEISFDENILNEFLDRAGIPGKSPHPAGDGRLVPIHDAPISLAVAGEACGDISAIGLVIHLRIFHRSLPVGHLREEIIDRGIGLRSEIADLLPLLIREDRSDLLLDLRRQHGRIADGLAQIVRGGANRLFIRIGAITASRSACRFSTTG